MLVDKESKICAVHSLLRNVVAPGFAVLMFIACYFVYLPIRVRVSGVGTTSGGMYYQRRVVPPT